MKITRITPQQSDPQRVNIFVDGEFYCGLDAFHIYGLSLKKGQELTPEQIEALEAVKQRESCSRKAMNLINYRDRTGFELRKRLMAAGFGETVVNETVETLVRIGAVNDAAFVRNYALSQKGRYPAGIILKKLWATGVPFSFSEPIVSEICGPEEAYGSALAAARKQAPLIKASSEYERKAKLVRYLQGRGYRGDTVFQAAAEALKELQ